jgi:hypothetical protein
LANANMPPYKKLHGKALSGAKAEETIQLIKAKATKAIPATMLCSFFIFPSPYHRNPYQAYGY